MKLVDELKNHEDPRVRDLCDLAVWLEWEGHLNRYRGRLEGMSTAAGLAEGVRTLGNVSDGMTGLRRAVAFINYSRKRNEEHLADLETRFGGCIPSVHEEHPERGRR